VKRIPTNDLAGLDQHLEAALNTDRGLGFRETVMKLAPRIQQLLANGYSFERIAALLREGGLSISGQTVRNYWRQAQSETRKDKKRGSVENQRPAQKPSSAPSMSDATKRRLPDLRATTARSTDEPEPVRDSTNNEARANNPRKGHFSVTPDSEKL
jgi:hypothetical protein